VTAASVAVVVPVHDDPGRLARCLDGLAAQTVACEVVVVDDGSAPALRPDLTGRRGVRLVEQANAGSYAARNAGLATTATDVVAFTDADCLPAPEWLARGLAVLQGGADVVAGHIEVCTSTSRPGAIELFDAVTAFPQEQFVRQWGFGATANLLVRRAAFDAGRPLRRPAALGRRRRLGRARDRGRLPGRLRTRRARAPPGSGDVARAGREGDADCARRRAAGPAAG
jgi:glycosyltransferase involved in cell wall biosynthesis